MLSKRSLIAVLGFSILLIPVAAAAQVAQVTGKVTLKQSDGRMTPVAGALVDLYRTDIRWEEHGNVISVVKDTPYLRTYRVDYVNMSRDVTESVGIATQVISGSVGKRTPKQTAAAGIYSRASRSSGNTPSPSAPPEPGPTTSATFGSLSRRPSISNSNAGTAPH